VIPVFSSHGYERFEILQQGCINANCKTIDITEFKYYNKMAMCALLPAQPRISYSQSVVAEEIDACNREICEDVHRGLGRAPRALPGNEPYS